MGHNREPTDGQKRMEERERNIARAMALKFPSEIKYFCKIHNIHETARLIGMIEIKGREPLVLYNTPEEHTLAHETIRKLESETFPRSEWEKYGYVAQ